MVVAAGDGAGHRRRRRRRSCVGAGLPTECTAVERPGVDIAAAAALARRLGADFRARSYHPPPTPAAGAAL